MSLSVALPLHPARAWIRPVLRILLAIVVCIAAGWGVRNAVLSRQLDLLSEQSRQRGEFYRRSLNFLLSRNESLPRIIALEDRLKALLQNPGQQTLHHSANNYLANVRDGAGINTAYLMDKQGLTLASSNFRSPGSYVGHNYGYRPYFQEALKGRLGRFYGVGATTGEPGFFLAAPIESEGALLGAVIVKISLENFESALVRSGDPVLLVDANGVIFLASVPEWKYHFLTPLEPGVLQQIGLSRQYDNQNLQPLGVNFGLQDEPKTVRVALPGGPEQDYLVQSIKTGTLGWSIVFLSRTGQERQNADLAGIAAGFAVALLLSTLVFYRLNVKRYKERRQAEVALRQAHKELEQRIAERTADLRATNASLEEKIDALKTTETILHETRDSAVQAGKLAVLGQMAAGISHEVNQPLTALHTLTDNAVDLLGRGRLEEVRENLGFIKQMALRMGHIVGEIKTFARKSPLERLAVNLSEVLTQALRMVESRRRQIGAQIDVEALPDDLRVLADVQRLEQVLVNLLLNALDAVAEGAEQRIAIGARCESGRASLVIHDSGPGIADEVLPHLFEPFFTTKLSGQGLGLGLAISRMIVAELGGRIDVCNHALGGAEFTVALEVA
ncbi:MAG: Signal transduction histidine kinase regulating C4-dicarboxylate transport system [Proteobacteria bacterium]|nr:Signal transduction histidine kinase regulating C4-dicarboxylate transport system [Pseudomonadota bacterium]MBS1228672.1 Signal transduction histidine kinase regulating C4-dicarboxylate transport system [Pseudomonadota bacterium]